MKEAPQKRLPTMAGGGMWDREPNPEQTRNIPFVGEGDGPEAGKTGAEVCETLCGS